MKAQLCKAVPFVTHLQFVLLVTTIITSILPIKCVNYVPTSQIVSNAIMQVFVLNVMLDSTKMATHVLHAVQIVCPVKELTQTVFNVVKDGI